MTLDFTELQGCAKHFWVGIELSDCGSHIVFFQSRRDKFHFRSTQFSVHIFVCSMKKPRKAQVIVRQRLTSGGDALFSLHWCHTGIHQASLLVLGAESILIFLEILSYVKVKTLSRWREVRLPIIFDLLLSDSMVTHDFHDDDANVEWLVLNSMWQWSLCSSSKGKNLPHSCSRCHRKRTSPKQTRSEFKVAQTCSFKVLEHLHSRFDASILQACTNPASKNWQ